MRTRKNIIFTAGIILVLVSIFMWWELADASKRLDTLALCFQTSKAKIEESVLSGWASIDKTFIGEQELSSKLDMIAIGLSLNESNAKKIIEIGDDMNKASLYSTKGSVNYTIVIESMRNNDKSEETYCTFRATFNSTYDNIMKYKYSVEKVFKDAKMPIELDMLISGSYQGKIAKKQGEYLIGKLLKNIDARKVESMDNEGVISVSAYSSRVGDYINSKGQKINVQIAIRYSEYDDKTYLWLGSPVIPFEY